MYEVEGAAARVEHFSLFLSEKVLNSTNFSFMPKLDSFLEISIFFKDSFEIN